MNILLKTRGQRLNSKPIFECRRTLCGLTATFPKCHCYPGVAQLGMVHDLLTDILKERRPVTRISRVRFKQMIRPDQPLVLTVKVGDQGASHSFRITGDEGLICSGQMRLGEEATPVPTLTGNLHSAGFFSKGDIDNMAADIDRIINRISEIMISELKLEDVTPDTFDPDIDLVDEVGIDSMDLATVALVLRDEYAVRIDEDDYPKLTTVRLIGEYIQNKLAA